MIQLRYPSFPAVSACAVRRRLDDRPVQPGRVIIITGAAGGIGRALVDAFAANGDVVVAVDLPDSGVIELGRNLGQPHLGLELDVSREDDVVALCALLEKRSPQIGVLVNNAGIGPTMAATVDTPVEDFQRARAVNLIGPYTVACETAKLMKPGAAIVNVASLAGMLGNPKRNGYAALKAALISITKSLACAWALRGIRVTAVSARLRAHANGREIRARWQVRRQRNKAPYTDGPTGSPRRDRADSAFSGERPGRLHHRIHACGRRWLDVIQPGGGACPAQDRTPEAELSRPIEGTDARTVVVMDGAKGIGAAIARRFAANSDTVVIADGDGGAAVKLAQLLGDKHLSRHVDRTVESEVVALFEELREGFGHIDVFVNVPGMNDTLLPDIEQAAAVFKHKCQSYWRLHLRARGRYIDAIWQRHPESRGELQLLTFATSHAYGAYNAGIDMLTRCTAAEFGPLGIRTAIVAPGHIRASHGIQSEMLSAVHSTSLRREIPMGRVGEPEEVAEAAYFLASSDASYIRLDPARGRRLDLVQRRRRRQRARRGNICGEYMATASLSLKRHLLALALRAQRDHGMIFGKLSRESRRGHHERCDP